MGVAFTAFDEAMMRLALEQAQLAERQGEVPVGAVLTLGKEVIATGYNQPILKHDPSAHAEIMALRLAGERLKNYRMLNTTLYVTLEPCAMCAGALVHARVHRVVYGATDPRTGAVHSQLPLLTATYHNHRIQAEGGLLAEMSAALLQNFFRHRRILANDT